MAYCRYSSSDMDNMTGLRSDARYSISHSNAHSVAYRLVPSASFISSTFLVEFFMVFNLVVIAPVISIISLFIFIFLA